MLVRVLTTVLLFILPGCLDMCGPTLDRLEFAATFDGELTAENRTAAREALAKMGFEGTQFDGPGGFYVRAGETRVFVGNRTAQSQPITTWVMDRDVENQEFQSGDAAHAAGRNLAPAHWAFFNATLTRFESHTGWQAQRPLDVEVLVFVC